MTLKQCLFEGGAQGDALTVPNTGASTVYTTGGGAAIFDSAMASHGAMGGKFTSGSDANGCFIHLNAAAANNTYSIAIVLTLPAAPPSSGGYALAQPWNSNNTRAFGIAFLSNGHLAVQDRTGTTKADWGGSSGGTITAGSKYLLTLWGVTATSTTGTLNAKLYNMAGTQVGSTYSASNVNLDAFPISGVRVGAIGDSSGTLVVGVDDLQIDDGRVSELPGITNTPPTVTLTGNQNVAAGGTATATATASDSDGSIASYAWTVLAAKSTSNPTLSTASTATVSFTAPAAGNLVTLQCVVTDNSGAATTVTTEVRVPTASDATALAMDDGTNSAWTKTGGVATKGGSLADSSDTTGSQSPSYSSTETEERHRLQPMTTRTTLTLTPRSVVSGTGGTTKFRLYEGNTLRQEWTLTQTTSAADQTCTVTTPGSITDWGSLWVAWSAVS